MYRMAIDQYEYSSAVELDDITIDLTLGKFHQLVDEAAANDVCIFAKVRQSDGLKIFELLGVPTTCVELTNLTSLIGDQKMESDQLSSYRIQTKPTLH